MNSNRLKSEDSFDFDKFVASLTIIQKLSDRFLKSKSFRLSEDKENISMTYSKKHWNQVMLKMQNEMTVMIRKFITRTLYETRFSEITNFKDLTFDNFLSILRHVWSRARKCAKKKDTPVDVVRSLVTSMKSIRSLVIAALQLPKSTPVHTLLSNFNNFDKDQQDAIILNFEKYRDANYPIANIRDIFSYIKDIEDVLTPFEVGEDVIIVMRFDKSIQEDVNKLARMVASMTRLKNLTLNKTVTGQFKLRVPNPHESSTPTFVVRDLTEDFFKSPTSYYFLVCRHTVDENDNFEYVSGRHVVDVDHDYIDVESVMIYDPDFEDENEEEIDDV